MDGIYTRISDPGLYSSTCEVCKRENTYFITIHIS